MMKKFLLLVAATLSLLSATVQADELTAAKRAQIKTLLELTGVKAIPDQIASNTVQSWVGGVKQLDPKFPDKGFTIARDAFAAALNAKIDGGGGLIEQVSLVYHNHFTHDEVRGLVAFYQTPLGRKLATEMPSMTQESMQAGLKWGQGLAPKLQERLRARFRERGVEL